ncbi:uncharacterized protein LOC128724661 [Anopheles nili]|uniref:uncharacterized protein LOC128724661 n=1 Tax=Anopheles nili TaxID=185578 RepID=UPI00237BD7FB|nr:uncharacterized protein LOC128724661 [Anopheles nili]
MRRNNRTRAGAGVGGGGPVVANPPPVAGRRGHENRLCEDFRSLEVMQGSSSNSTATSSNSGRNHSSSQRKEQPVQGVRSSGRNNGGVNMYNYSSNMVGTLKLSSLLVSINGSNGSAASGAASKRKGLSESIHPATLVEHVVADKMQQNKLQQQQQKQRLKMLAGTTATSTLGGGSSSSGSSSSNSNNSAKYRQTRQAPMILESDSTSGEDEDEPDNDVEKETTGGGAFRMRSNRNMIMFDPTDSDGQNGEDDDGETDGEEPEVTSSPASSWPRRVMPRRGSTSIAMAACDTTSSLHEEAQEEDDTDASNDGVVEGGEEEEEEEDEEIGYDPLQDTEMMQEATEYGEEYVEAANDSMYSEGQDGLEIDDDGELLEYADGETIEEEEQEGHAVTNSMNQSDNGQQQEYGMREDEDDEVIDVEEHEHQMQLESGKQKQCNGGGGSNNNNNNHKAGEGEQDRSDSVIYEGPSVEFDEMEMIKISAINTKVRLNAADRVSLEDFEMLKVLGTGAYGTVYMVRKLTGVDKNKIYAMKVLKKGIVSLKKKTAEHTRTERQVLEAIQDAPFLVTMHYAFQTDSKLYLILDYVIGGELFTHLCQKHSFSESEVQIYIAEIIVAIEYLHKLGIVYRDIKLENILIDVDGHVVLTDFGLSRELLYENERTHSFCGTVEYMAPEILRSSQLIGHDSTVDWWSVGVLTFELLTGGSPFSSEATPETTRRILETDAVIPENISPEATDFIRKLLVKDPKRRLGSGKNDAADLKSHPFMQSINWSRLIKKQLNSPFPPVVEDELDTRNFSAEFTNQEAVEKPCAAPKNADRLFRGYSYVSPKLLSKSIDDRNKFIPYHNMRPEENFIRQSASKQSPFFRKYELMDDAPLGIGSYSTCLKCQRLRQSGNNFYSVKVMFNHPQTAQLAKHEVTALRQCQGHPNVVRFIELLEDSNYVYIVLEYLDGGELLQHLNRQLTQLTEREVRIYFCQLVDAVAYIHRQGYVHRDLKPENILFERRSSDRLRLIDFGFAERLDGGNEASHIPAGTLGYVAPEVLGCTPSSSSSYALEATDVWSLGVVLYTMLCGQAPFTPRQFFGHKNLASAARHMEYICDKIRRGSIDLSTSIWLGVSDSAKNLVRDLLTVDPDKRLTMQELLRHRWLQESTEHQGRQLSSQAQLTYQQLKANVRNTYDAFKMAERSGFRLRKETARRSRGPVGLMMVQPAQRERISESNGLVAGGSLTKSNSVTTAVPNHNPLSSSNCSAAGGVKNKRTHRQNGEIDVPELSGSTTKSMDSKYSSSIEESTSSGIGRSKSSKSSFSHSGSPMRDTCNGRHLSNGSVVIIIDDDEEEANNKAVGAVHRLREAAVDPCAPARHPMPDKRLVVDAQRKHHKAIGQQVQAEQTDEIVADVEEDEPETDEEFNASVCIRSPKEAESNNNNVGKGRIVTKRRKCAGGTSKIATAAEQQRTPVCNNDQVVMVSKDACENIIGLAVGTEVRPSVQQDAAVMCSNQESISDDALRNDKENERPKEPPSAVASSSNEMPVPNRTEESVSLFSSINTEACSPSRAVASTQRQATALQVKQERFDDVLDTMELYYGPFDGQSSYESDDDDVVFAGFDYVLSLVDDDDEHFFSGYDLEESEIFYGFTPFDLTNTVQPDAGAQPSTSRVRIEVEMSANHVHRLDLRGVGISNPTEPAKRIMKRRPEVCADEPRPKRLRQMERKNYSLTRRRNRYDTSFELNTSEVF